MVSRIIVNKVYIVWNKNYTNNNCFIITYYRLGNFDDLKYMRDIPLLRVIAKRMQFLHYLWVTIKGFLSLINNHLKTQRWFYVIHIICHYQQNKWYSRKGVYLPISKLRLKSSATSKLTINSFKGTIYFAGKKVPTYRYFSFYFCWVINIVYLGKRFTDTDKSELFAWEVSKFL